MTTYIFNMKTGEYMGEAAPVVDPRASKRTGETVYALPGPNETTTPPPPRWPAKTAPVWDGTAWNIVADHRGESWFTEVGDEYFIRSLGDPTTFDPTAYKIKPPSIEDEICISRHQAKMALLVTGQLEMVEALMLHPDTSPGAKLAWTEARDFYRDNAFILELAPALNMTDEELDALFAYASTL